MRIIAGANRRTQLQSPRGDKTRPTLERVRESLFMRLHERLGEARVLDLFAGAGALGFEALSRGAREVTLVDSSAEALAALRANAKRLGGTDRSRVVKSDASAFLARKSPPGAPYDLVFLDPPYGRGIAAEVLALLGSAGSRLLAPDALGIAQVGIRDALEERYGALGRIDTRSYGETRIDIFQLGPGANGRAAQEEERP